MNMNKTKKHRVFAVNLGVLVFTFSGSIPKSNAQRLAAACIRALTGISSIPRKIGPKA